VEESILPRLYREAPLNSIWEGSGNVNALDVLRAIAREPESVEAFFAEVEQGRGDRTLDSAVADLKGQLADPSEAEARARRLVERMALVLEASLLVRHAEAAVADTFIESRLGDGGHQFGTLKPSQSLPAIIQRHTPLA
jgi:putative acyl-CoA dehydrogenase